MRRLDNRLIGIDQGQSVLFSDFEEDGPMWTGNGTREKRVAATFSEAFRSVPIVQVALSMWDTDKDANQRLDLWAEDVTTTGFQIVFRTWADSRIARVRADWLAIGEVRGEADWPID